MPYYFLKNLQGDIIAITDANGTTVARYTYDAWGVPTVTQDTTTVGIATLNPYRYRGYYYDTEIGMYYLQSRYYDPTVGRFVNGDSTDSFPNEFLVLENNLFIYCKNDPINKTDHNGSMVWEVIKKIIVGVLKGFISQLLVDVIKFLYNFLFVSTKSKFIFSNIIDYLQSIIECVISELLSFIPDMILFVRIASLLIKYGAKIIVGKMTVADWGAIVIEVLSIILSKLMPKAFSRKKDARLEKLRQYRKNKKKNKKLKNPVGMNATTIKLKYEKSILRFNISLEISSVLLNAFLQAIPV